MLEISHNDLASGISRTSGIPLIKVSSSMFANKEICVKIQENIRNKDIFIIQTGVSDEVSGFSVNDHIIETLILIDACKRAGVSSITLLMPCYPYARQDKKNDFRASISGKLIANTFQSMSINRIVFLDLHAPQIEGFFDIHTNNIYSVNLVIDYLESRLFEGLNTEEKQQKFILVSPDAGATKRTLKFGEYMNLNTIIMHKQRDYSQQSVIEKVMLICDNNDCLSNKTAIILDDICDTAGTLIAAANTIITYGAKEVLCVITHGIFSGPALDRINKL